MRLPSKHPNSQVECPRCAAMPGERCNTKNNKPFAAECDAHVERIRKAAEKYRADEKRSKEEQALVEKLRQDKIDAMDKRIVEFIQGYTALCLTHGLALLHEDGHGAFIVTDRNVPYHTLRAARAKIALS
jgi:hypothetical protein